MLFRSLLSFHPGVLRLLSLLEIPPRCANLISFDDWFYRALLSKLFSSIYVPQQAREVESHWPEPKGSYYLCLPDVDRLFGGLIVAWLFIGLAILRSNQWLPIEPDKDDVANSNAASRSFFRT